MLHLVAKDPVNPELQPCLEHFLEPKLTAMKMWVEHQESRERKIEDYLLSDLNQVRPEEGKTFKDLFRVIMEELVLMRSAAAAS